MIAEGASERAARFSAFGSAERVDEIVGLAWALTTARYAQEKSAPSNERQVQMQMAIAIQTLSPLFAFADGELIRVEPEYEFGDDNIDLVVHLRSGNEHVAVPIEFKVKLIHQGAQDLGSIHIFRDLFRLERFALSGASVPLGFFMMLTNDAAYQNKPRGDSLRSVFDTSQGARIQKGKVYDYPKKAAQQALGEFKSRYGSDMKLRSDYEFRWQNIGFLHSLVLEVHPDSLTAE